MTGRISLIITVVGAALALAVPAAWGAERQGPGNLAVSPEVYELTVPHDGSLAGRLGPGSLAVSPEVYRMTVLAERDELSAAAPASLGSGLNPDASYGVASTPRDKEREALASYYKKVFSTDSFSASWSQRAPAHVLGDASGIRYTAPVGDSHGRVDLGNSPASRPTISSGTEINWPELGIGFAAGMVLLLGLILAVRVGRSRPLAH